MAVTCRSPRLLDASFRETARLRPAALSCQLQLTDASAATMTLTRQDPVPAMHDWVELYAARGSLGLYRATALQRNHDRDTTVTLRHAIDTLSDNVWRVRDYDYSGTVAGYLAQLLTYQTHVYWQLGTVEDTGSWKRSGINYTRLSELLWELAGERHGYYFTYDFSTTPWTLNFLALPSAPAAEWRLTRNVHTLQLIRNDEDLCTRLYCTVSTTTATTPQGYTPEELDGRTVPVTDLGTVTVTDSAVHTYDNLEAQAIYGIVEKTADIDAEDVANPAAWAAEFLADRAEPTVQITIDGYELAAATGDSWDAFDLGKMTRCILADSGEILHERVVAITYPDLLGEPEHVTVELANRLAKFTDSLASVQTAASAASATAKKASRGGGSSTKDMEHWAMIVKKAVESLDGTGLVDLWETGIELDAQTGAKLYSLFQGPGTSSQGVLQVMNNEVKAKASQTSVNDLTTRMGQAEIDIDAAEAAITLKASQTDVDALGSRVSQAEIDIDGAEAQISLVVSNGYVRTRLAVECNNVTISNGNLVVDGYVSAAAFEAEQAKLNNLMTGQAQASTISTQTLRAGNAYAANLFLNNEEFAKHNIFMGGTTVSGFYLGDANLNLAHYHAITATENNGVITITQGAAQDTAGSASFDIADTQFYKDAVASAKNAMGVQIDQANQSVVVAESATKSALIASTVNLIYNTNNHKYTATTAATANGTTMHTNSAVSGTEAYEAGEDDGYTAGYSEGVNDGYKTGWNAAVAAITRNGNSIIGPKTSDGSSYTTETKYTANYVASSYTEEEHKYTPSTYVAETHSYTASSYTAEETETGTYTALTQASDYDASSHTNASMTVKGTTYTSTTSVALINYTGAAAFNKGTYHASSYTKEKTGTGYYTYLSKASSYTPSSHSYVASVYDAETHSYKKSSYTASSFSWS